MNGDNGWRMNGGSRNYHRSDRSRRLIKIPVLPAECRSVARNSVASRRPEVATSSHASVSRAITSHELFLIARISDTILR